MAEHLVKSCMQYQEFHKNLFLKRFTNLRTSVLAVLSKAAETTSISQIHDVLCGPGLHTSTTESFFQQTTYSSDAFDKDGKLLVHKFPSYTSNSMTTGTDTWKCSPTLCLIPPKSDANQNVAAIYENIATIDPLQSRLFIQNMDKCSNKDLHDSARAR